MGKVVKFVDIRTINGFIQRTHCSKAEFNLTDAKLMKKYKATPSAQKRITELTDCLHSAGVNKAVTRKIMNHTKILDTFCVPPGTKGVVRGNAFNAIVRKKLITICKSVGDDLHLAFETKVSCCSEIPDWTIVQQSTKKLLIGMNQIDLWTGGQQINRGWKYIFESTKKQTKILCVVCKYYQLRSTRNRMYKLFQHGFRYNRLCYLNNLENLIRQYFKLKF